MGGEEQPGLAEADRPSDEAILEQQNIIRAEEAEKIPFVADKEPITNLKAEYEAGNPIFAFKIEKLSERYSDIRRTRGDGNCFFRGFLFAYLESLSNADDSTRVAEMERMKTQVVDKCKKDLVSVGYAELTWEEFATIFCEQLDNTSLESRDQRISTLVQNMRDPEFSNYAVMFLRFVTSCAIQKKHDFFDPFISGTTGLDVVQFCRAMVEPMGEESDHIHITALTAMLGVSVQVVYLDRTEGDTQTHDFIPELEAEGIPVSQLPPIALLYRPGHYDVLYRRQ